ncbi:hypothetical protein TNCV_3712051 [Trichonephila clavipes]|uniref:Uncharacterized protein n=1 Tax=Trichonephila clavipes TaxID=2585209 RepID=A0A8X6UVW8_TRICX|nr:hypothetical protein TNCV_3712051 [Trichonephila clavipes]
MILSKRCVDTSPYFLNCIVTEYESWCLRYNPEMKRQNTEWHSPASPNIEKLGPLARIVCIYAAASLCVTDQHPRALSSSVAVVYASQCAFKMIESTAKKCEMRSVIRFRTARNMSAADVHRTEAMSNSKIRKWVKKFKDE